MDFSQLTIVFVVWGDYAQYLDDAIAPLGDIASDRILVVDNGAVPPVPEGRYRLSRTSHHLSAGAARNFGLRQVTTPFVCFGDVDDVLVSDFLGQGVRYLERNKGIAYAGKDIYVQAVDGSPVERRQWPRSTPNMLAFLPSALASFCLWKNCIPITGAVLRTEAVRSVAGFSDQSLHDDWTLAVELALIGKVKLTDEPAMYCRFHHDSLSRRPRSSLEYQEATDGVMQRYARSPYRPWYASVVVLLARVHHHQGGLRGVLRGWFARRPVPTTLA